MCFLMRIVPERNVVNVVIYAIDLILSYQQRPCRPQHLKSTQEEPGIDHGAIPVRAHPTLAESIQCREFIYVTGSDTPIMDYRNKYTALPQPGTWSSCCLLVGVYRLVIPLLTVPLKRKGDPKAGTSSSYSSFFSAPTLIPLEKRRGRPPLREQSQPPLPLQVQVTRDPLYDTTIHVCVCVHVCVTVCMCICAPVCVSLFL